MLNLMDNPVIETPSVFKRFRNYIASASYFRTIGIISLLIVIAAIPLTVFISQKQQELRQQASESTIEACKGTSGGYQYDCAYEDCSTDLSPHGEWTSYPSSRTCADPADLCCRKPVTITTTSTTKDNRFACQRCSNQFKYYWAKWNTSSGTNCEAETYNNSKEYEVNCACDGVEGKVVNGVAQSYIAQPGTVYTKTIGESTYRLSPPNCPGITTTTTTTSARAVVCPTSNCPGGYDYGCYSSCPSGWSDSAYETMAPAGSACGSNICCYRNCPTTTTTTSTTTTTVPVTTTLTAPPVSGDTILTFNIGLDGIGTVGDNLNPDATDSTKNPLHPVRNLLVSVFDRSNQVKVDKKETQLVYASTTGRFTGSINLGSFASDDYTVKIKGDGFLRRLIPGIQTLKPGSNTMTQVNLVNGDINKDNTINILDYNIFISCSSFTSVTSRDSTLCDSNPDFKIFSDLYDDGTINRFDYNLFLREFSVQNGD